MSNQDQLFQPKQMSIGLRNSSSYFINTNWRVWMDMKKSQELENIETQLLCFIIVGAGSLHLRSLGVGSILRYTRE